MNVEKIAIDRARARELYREYKKHQHWSEPMDDEIRRAYQLISQGRLVIQAFASIKAAGLGDDKFPKLAIIRADATICHLDIWQNGSAVFQMDWGTERHHWHRRIALPDGTFPVTQRRYSRDSAKAIVPIIPVHLRPKRGLANYHILFEAEWTPIPPHDPYLLRRIGKGDLWLVMAAWDLTEVERAVLASRVSG